MSRFTNTLGRVRVAAPCEEDWDEMRGDARVRFCSRCSLNVYNLSAMTRREAERLVLGAEGRLCVRFYRRRDGTILTQNCPTGLIKLKRRVSRVVSAAAAAVVGLFAGVASAPQAEHALTSETEAALTPPELVVMTMPAATGSAEMVVANGVMSMEAEAAGEAEAFTMSEGAMSLDPIEMFAPFAVCGGLLTLLTWPLLLLGDRLDAPRREELRIWSNEWSLPDERSALPRETSAVEPELASPHAPVSALPLEV